MCLLNATRQWSRLWRNKRVRLRLRNDNIGALSVFSSLKGSSNGMSAIAREYAMDAGQGAYAPRVVSHLPGITNTVADILSRRNDPKYAASWSVPTFLARAERVYPCSRPLSWWQTRCAPVASQT